MPLIFGVDRKEDFILDPDKRGYAARPGTGPQGEKCKTCKHIERQSMGNIWFKCGLMRALWTHGRGTDIKVSSPACRRWEKKDAD